MASVVRVGDPLWINRGLSTRDVRVATAGLLAQPWSNDRMEVRGGILPDSKLTAFRVVPTQPTSSMGVQVNGGHAVVTHAGQGAWIVPLEATIPVLDIPAADPANGRIDLVVLRVYDLDQGDTPPLAPDSGSRGVATVEVVSGSPAGIPVAPTLPIRSLLLATITTTPVTTSIESANIAERRVFTVPRGGVRPAGNASAADALPSHVGEVVASADGTLRVGVDDSVLPYRGVQVKPRLITTTFTGGYQYSTGTTTMGTLSIPDPGFPYQLDVMGSFDVVTDGAAIEISVHCALDSAFGFEAAMAGFLGQAVTSVEQRSVHVGPGFGTVYTGAHTLYVVALIRFRSSSSYGYRFESGALTARIIPQVGT